MTPIQYCMARAWKQLIDKGEVGQARVLDPSVWDRYVEDAEEERERSRRKKEGK